MRSTWCDGTTHDWGAKPCNFWDNGPFWRDPIITAWVSKCIQAYIYIYIYRHTVPSTLQVLTCDHQQSIIISVELDRWGRTKKILNHPNLRRNGPTFQNDLGHSILFQDISNGKVDSSTMVFNRLELGSLLVFNHVLPKNGRIYGENPRRRRQATRCTKKSTSIKMMNAHTHI